MIFIDNAIELGMLAFQTGLTTGNSISDLATIGSPLPYPSPSPVRFECSICTRGYARHCRAEACQNRHTGMKPYPCLQACGRHNWYVSLKGVQCNVNPRTATQNSPPKQDSAGTACQRNGAINNVGSGASISV